MRRYENIKVNNPGDYYTKQYEAARYWSKAIKTAKKLRVKDKTLRKIESRLEQARYVGD